MILIDTSMLVDALAGPRRSLSLLVRVIDSRGRVKLSSIVAYEWLRGPRTERELAIQEGLFPVSGAIAFDATDAEIAARLYKAVRRARAREVDLAIAACAIRHEAELWTANRSDFADIPGLRLFSVG